MMTYRALLKSTPPPPLPRSPPLCLCVCIYREYWELASDIHDYQLAYLQLMDEKHIDAIMGPALGTVSSVSSPFPLPYSLIPCLPACLTHSPMSGLPHHTPPQYIYARRLLTNLNPLPSSLPPSSYLPTHSGLPAFRHGDGPKLESCCTYAFIANLLHFPAGCVPITTVRPEETTYPLQGSRNPDGSSSSPCACVRQGTVKCQQEFTTLVSWPPVIPQRGQFTTFVVL